MVLRPMRRVPKASRVTGSSLSVLALADCSLQCDCFSQNSFVNEILFIDTAGGFGGTWWWNQYPGLACDVESYIYMPLLEETNYMSSQKYVTGTELRDHACRIASQWNLKERALFNTKVNDLTWNHLDGQWIAHITRSRQTPTTFRSEFVILATGLLDSAKIYETGWSQYIQGKGFPHLTLGLRLHRGNSNQPNDA